MGVNLKVGTKKFTYQIRATKIDYITIHAVDQDEADRKIDELIEQHWYNDTINLLVPDNDWDDVCAYDEYGAYLIVEYFD